MIFITFDPFRMKMEKGKFEKLVANLHEKKRICYVY